MDEAFTLTVNGKREAIKSDPQRPLLQVLREDLKLTGTKYGCGEGQCGACVVLVDGKRIQSCLVPVKDVSGLAVTTIEGLSTEGKLHPVQEAFAEEGAMQCGFCTSGMVLSTIALLNETPKPTSEQIVAWMNPQMCRCCGYPRILEAIDRVVSQTGK